MSDQPKHTPGPWRIKSDGDSETYAVVGRKGKPVARPDSPRYAADLALLLAAPDLLEALKAVVRVADRATVEFDAARAAIAKAEGKQP